MGVSTYQFANLYSWYSWPNVILPIVGGYLMDTVFGFRLCPIFRSPLLPFGVFSKLLHRPKIFGTSRTKIYFWDVQEHDQLPPQSPPSAFYADHCDFQRLFQEVFASKSCQGHLTKLNSCKKSFNIYVTDWNWKSKPGAKPGKSQYSGGLNTECVQHSNGP